MGPEIIAEVYSYALLIYQAAQEVKANKHQCKALATRIMQAKNHIEGLADERKNERWYQCLQQLHELLEEAFNFISQFKKKNWAHKVIFRGTHRETFLELNTNLTQIQGDLMLGIAAQAVVDKDAELQDRQALLSQQAEILLQLQQQNSFLLGHHLQQLQLEAPEAPIASELPSELVKEKIIAKYGVSAQNVVCKNLLAETNGAKYYHATYCGEPIVLMKINFISNLEKQAFLREIAATARLGNTHVLSLVGAFFNENEGSILFEAADAMLTPEKIQTASDLQLYQWLTGIISALNYLHKKAIAHGNLTLSTIMLCDGQIKLTSFTYASLQATTMNQLNKLSIEKFSANLAPELINGQCEEPTPKSDIYSFGKLLETFFTGRRKELITLQQQCIDSDPAKRPNAADLLLQLINFERPLKMKQANDIYENGRRAEAAKNFLLAAQHYQSAAELGSTKALTNIATFYREGQAGLPTDLQKAFELTHIAAQSGHTRAMQNLAAHYQQGIGVTQDTEKANYWLQRKKRLENAPN